MVSKALCQPCFSFIHVTQLQATPGEGISCSVQARFFLYMTPLAERAVASCLPSPGDFQPTWFHLETVISSKDFTPLSSEQGAFPAVLFQCNM